MPTARTLAALALLAGGAAMLPATGHAKKPPRLVTAHHVQSVSCVPGAANTVRAAVAMRMTVVNYDGFGDWADHMEMKVRLESTAPGINIHSNWKKWKTPYLTQNKRHAYNIRVVTDNKSGSASWRVRVKLIWHRPAPIPNVTRTLSLPFNASCAPQTGGSGVVSASP
jgi:hypothetical protein